MARWQDLVRKPEEISRLSTEELRRAVNKLSSVANKRLKRLQEKDILFSTQLHGEGEYISGVKKFSTKGKKLGQLRSEYKRVVGFLEEPLSTIKGRQQEYYEFMKRAKEEQGEEYTEKEARKEYKEKGEEGLFQYIGEFFRTMREEDWIHQFPDLASYSSKQIKEMYEESYIRSDKDFNRAVVDFLYRVQQGDNSRVNEYGVNSRDDEQEDNISTSSFF